jgi:homoaconitate hydratase
MGLTLVEKIATRHTDGLATGTMVRAGDFVSIRPRHVMTHDNTGAVMPKFRQIGATAIADPAQPVFAIDHDIQNVTPKNLEKYAKIEAFARDQGIDFYPAGTGISHQVMVEQGYVVIDGKSFPFPPLSPAAQELIVAGGAENLVAARLRAKT